MLNEVQALWIVILMILGTLITRFLPFILFPANKETPSYIIYLGKVLPYSMIGLLVVYCFKGVSLTSGSYGIPELLAVLCIVVLHLWRNSTLLSIGFGTLIYMLLVQFVFA